MVTCIMIVSYKGVARLPNGSALGKRRAKSSLSFRISRLLACDLALLLVL
jgi:hypothetical protein